MMALARSVAVLQARQIGRSFCCRILRVIVGYDNPNPRANSSSNKATAHRCGSSVKRYRM